MKLPRRRFLHLAAGAAALPAVPRFAFAQAYPTRPVRLIVGFPAGGLTDILARLLGPWLSQRLGQQFIVEDQPGAGTNLATEAVVRVLPDGYTFLMATSTNAINATLYDKLKFNFIRDTGWLGFHCPPCPGEVTMSHAAFARIDGFGNLISNSPEVLGMAHCLDSPSQSPRPFGAYCFNLNFTPTSVIANPIAHPNDDEFGPLLYTAGPNVIGQFTKDKNGRGVECPAGFQHAAVVGRRTAGDGIGIPPGGFFVMFFG